RGSDLGSFYCRCLSPCFLSLFLCPFFTSKVFFFTRRRKTAVDIELLIFPSRSAPKKDEWAPLLAILSALPLTLGFTIYFFSILTTISPPTSIGHFSHVYGSDEFPRPFLQLLVR